MDWAIFAKFILGILSAIFLFVETIILFVNTARFHQIEWKKYKSIRFGGEIYINPGGSRNEIDDDLGGCHLVADRNFDSDRVVPCILIAIMFVLTCLEIFLRIKKEREEVKDTLDNIKKRWYMLYFFLINTGTGFLTINMMWIVQGNFDYCFGYKQNSVYSDYYKDRHEGIQSMFMNRWPTIGTTSGVLLILAFIFSAKKITRDNGEEYNELENLGWWLLIAGYISLVCLFFMNTFCFFLVSFTGWWGVIATLEAVEDGLDLIVTIVEIYSMFNPG